MASKRGPRARYSLRRSISRRPRALSGTSVHPAMGALISPLLAALWPCRIRIRRVELLRPGDKAPCNGDCNGSAGQGRSEQAIFLHTSTAWLRMSSFYINPESLRDQSPPAVFPNSGAPILFFSLLVPYSVTGLDCDPHLLLIRTVDRSKVVGYLQPTTWLGRQMIRR